MKFFFVLALLPLACSNAVDALENIGLNRILAVTVTDFDAFSWAGIKQRSLAVSGCGYCSLDKLCDGMWAFGAVTASYETLNYSNAIKSCAASIVAMDGAATSGRKILTSVKFNNSRAPFVLGYRLLNKHKADVSIMGHVIAPRVFVNKTICTFQSMPKVGAGICAHIGLVKGEKYTVNCDLNGHWTYSFKHKDEKIIPQHNTDAWAHYRLVGAPANPQTVTPLAKILFEKMTVAVGPNNEFWAGCRLSFEKGGLDISASYEFQYLLGRTLAISGLEAADNYQFVTSTDASNATNNYGGAAITPADFYSTGPSIIRHHIGVDVSYLFSEWEFPLLLGLSGFYAFTQKRSITPEYWGIGLRTELFFQSKAT